MANQKTKVLVGYIMDGKSGGTDAYLLNFFEQVRGVDVAIDFLTTKIDKELQEELHAKGARLFEVPSLRQGRQQKKQIMKLIEENEYDVCYMNISTAINNKGIKAARAMDVKKRIIHSHSAGNDCDKPLRRIALNTLHRLKKSRLYKAGTMFLAPSKKAGLWMFPPKVIFSQQFHVIKNAIDTKKYAFDKSRRDEVRNEFGFSPKSKVVGFVGNFCYQKNVFYMIEVFHEICKKEQSFALMMVGDGPHLEKAKQMAREKGLEDKVLFLGRRSDVASLMQGMDIFVLPSRFEGLGIVGLEAQAAGLPCVFSNKVPDEVIVTENCTFLPLRNKERWADAIIDVSSIKRKDQSEKIRLLGYDIFDQKNELREIIIG